MNLNSEEIVTTYVYPFPLTIITKIVGGYVLTKYNLIDANSELGGEEMEE